MTPTPVEVVAAVAVRTWRKTARRPSGLLFSFVQPLLWMLFFGFLFQRYSVELSGLSYASFVLPGICAMSVLFGASQSGVPLLHDLQTGFLSRILGTPAPALLVLGGKLVADVARLLAQATAVAGLGLLVGARLEPGGGAILAAAVILAVFAAAWGSLSCLIALTTRAQETMAGFIHLANVPLLFTSTALVPARHMPGWLAAVARWNPLTLTADALRGALLHGETPALARALIPLGSLAVILFLLAGRAMRAAARDPER
jgi:ABC transporter DrrB family efflux protein